MVAWASQESSRGGHMRSKLGFTESIEHEIKHHTKAQGDPVRTHALLKANGGHWHPVNIQPTTMTKQWQRKLAVQKGKHKHSEKHIVQTRLYPSN